MKKSEEKIKHKTTCMLESDEKELLDKLCEKNRDNQSKTIGIAIKLLAKKEGITLSI